MKITIEAEEGDINTDSYPATLVRVKEFILVGYFADPAGQRQEINHLRRGGNTVSLRSLAWAAIEQLRQATTLDIVRSICRSQQVPDKSPKKKKKRLRKSSNGGDGSK